MVYRLFTKIALEHFALGLQLPILVALPLSRGISLIEIGTLQAILAVFIFCFEVPSGYIADKFGRKYTMGASSIAFAIGYGMFALAQSFIAFIVPFILMGIGFAMLSGADEAYLFDFLKEHKKEKEYRAWYARLTMVDEVSTILGLISSTAIAYLIDPSAVFMFAAVVMFVTALYAFTVLEEPSIQTKDAKTTVQQFEKTPMALIKRAFSFLRFHMAFAIILLVFAFIDESGRLLWQPRILELGFTISEIGIIYAGLKVFSIIGAWLSSKISVNIKKIHFLGISLFAAFAFALIGFGNIYITIGGLALYFLVENVFRVFRSEYLNKRVESKYRTTFLSLHSFTTQSIAAFFVIILGAVADQRLVYGFVLLIGLKIVASIIIFCLPDRIYNMKIYVKA